MLSAEETISDSKTITRATVRSRLRSPSVHAVSASEKGFLLRTLHSFATICVLSAAVAALLPACSSDPEPVPPGTAGAAGAPAVVAGAPGAGSAGAPAAAGATGDPTKGAAVWTAQACASCHAETAAGREGPNITMSVTAGIGAWTYQQFHDAVRLAKDTDGTDLCPLMQKFPETSISEAGMLDLYAFIKTKPISDVANEGTYKPLCP